MVGLEQRIACNFQRASLFLSDAPLSALARFSVHSAVTPVHLSYTSRAHTPLTYSLSLRSDLSRDPSGFSIVYPTPDLAVVTRGVMTVRCAFTYKRTCTPPPDNIAL